MNFSHKVHLVEAERRALSGDDAGAIRHFEKAIALSHGHGFLHETALAQERSARFYFDRGLERLGRHQLREAHHSYTRWGADAKAQLLESEYAQHFALLSAGFDAPEGAGHGRFTEALDYRNVLKASQTISGEIVLPRLLEQLLRIMLRHAGAQRGILILEREGRLTLEARADVDTGRLEFLSQQPLEGTSLCSEGIVYYAARTETIVALVDAALEGQFVRDPYVLRERPKSVLCAPMLCQGKLMGLVYLENNRLSHVFSAARLEILNLLATQAAISIANARFHSVQLEAQQAKINPHFLFNCLSSIADVALSDGKTAEMAIVKLAHLYRYILTNASGQLVTMDQEMSVVRSYLSLEKLRFGAKLEIDVSCEGAAALVKLPGLLVQPLVENSIRHGIATKVGVGSVSVRASVRAGRCSIVVRDDGDGAQPSTSGTGFGLRSVQERLALVYGDDYSFSIERVGGYRVEIEIPAVVDGARAV